MTCIVGFLDNGDVYMGGDSSAVGKDSYRVIDSSKVFIRENMIFGFAESFRMGQILKSSFLIPPKQENMTDEEYLQGTFIDSLIHCLEEKKYATVTDNVATGGIFLLGYNGKLYLVQDDFSLLSSQHDYESIGCGESYAMGALSLIQKYRPKMKPEKKIVEALTAASRFSYVIKPFHVLKLGPE